MLQAYAVTESTSACRWEMMDVQIGLDENKCPFAKLLLRSPRWNKAFGDIVEWLLHQPRLSEMHNIWVEIQKNLRGV